MEAKAQMLYGKLARQLERTDVVIIDELGYVEPQPGDAREVPETMLGDPIRLRQILFNLVGNAIKFTAEGEIIVDVLYRWTSDGQVEVHFAVSDSGIGVDPSKMEAIFESFAQADGSTTRRFGGTGLGLAIAQRLAHMMQGHIWAESKPDEGSVFHAAVCFRMRDEAGPQRPAPTFRAMGNQKVLVADSGKVSGSVLVETLAAHGIVPEFVNTADEAWTRLTEIYESGHAVALAFIDIDLVDSRGDRLADRFLQNWGCVGNTILLARMNGPIDLSRWMESGSQPCVLYKPIIEKDVDGPNSLPLRIDADQPNLGKLHATRRVGILELEQAVLEVMRGANARPAWYSFPPSS
ncbi:MAG: hypothetical protein HC809_15350 [Gammaproteobacteria bacterium]|nr:hypothetical protein [Gammaproteobacteria bacterium]